MKRMFPCGHKGQGKFCHRCKTAEVLEKKPREVQPEHEKSRLEAIARLRQVPGRPIVPQAPTDTPTTDAPTNT